jgi:hypothetical protein
MELGSSSDADNCLAAQENPRPLYNPKVHSSFHKIPPLDPVFSHMNTVHVHTPCFFKISFVIVW